MTNFSQARDSLCRKGFCKVSEVVPPEILARCDQLSAKFLSRQSEEERRALRALGSLISVESEPAFGELIALPSILQAATRLGFGPLRFSAGYIVSKAPHSPQAFWHQDWGFWQESCSYEDPCPQFSALIYLRDVSEHNGCPRFLPGSHRRRHALHEILRHSDRDALRRMDDPNSLAFAKVEGEANLGANAGDLVVFDPRVLHCTHPNRSAHRRTAIVLWYYAVDRISPSIQAFAATQKQLSTWPKAARERVSQLLWASERERPQALLSKHPDHRLL